MTPTGFIHSFKAIVASLGTAPPDDKTWAVIRAELDQVELPAGRFVPPSSFPPTPHIEPDRKPRTKQFNLK